MAKARRKIDVEDFLVWVVRDQRADVIVGRGVGLYAAERVAAGIAPWEVSRDGCAAVERNGRLGTVVDGARGVEAAGALHPDAEIAWEAVAALPKGMRARVVEAARTASRPLGVAMGRPRFVPQMNKKGRPRAILDDNDHVVGTMVTTIFEASLVDAARRDYLAWWDALAHVRSALDGRLRDHDVVGPAAPRMPWAPASAANRGAAPEAAAIEAAARKFKRSKDFVPPKGED